MNTTQIIAKAVEDLRYADDADTVAQKLNQGCDALRDAYDRALEAGDDALAEWFAGMVEDIENGLYVIPGAIALIEDFVATDLAASEI